jgi:predicted phage gp36 major capsid-like protein
MATVQTAHAQGSTLLPRKIADMIFEDVARTSIVQQLARRIDLPANGVAIPVTTGKPSASWVAEGGRKPASNASVGTKLMDPKKLTCIVVFSREYLNRDTTKLFSMIRPQIKEAFADAFDAAAIHGTSTPFTDYLTATRTRVLTDAATTNADATVTSATGAFTSKDVGRPISGAGIPAAATILSINSATSIELSANATATATGVTVTINTTKKVELGTASQATGGVYKDIVNGLTLLAQDRKKLSGFAADPLAEPLLLGATDTTGRPLMIDVGGDGLTQRLLGRPVGFGDGVAGVTGANALRFVGGDWSKVAYGVGSEISYQVSNEASIEMIPGDATSVKHLFQDNLVALLAEAEYGLVVGDTDAFVQYVDAV